MGRPTPLTALFGTSEFLGQLLDARLYVGLQVVRALVLGDGAQHLLQADQALLRLARVAIRLLGFLVFGRDVGGHMAGFYLTGPYP
jgi:hypothetical protein